MNTKVTEPVVGQVYMATRYYNSKRIILEPFRFQVINPPNPQMTLQYKYGGEWVMDARTTKVGALYSFQPNWVNRKLDSLREESAVLASHILNLQRLQT